MLLSIDSPHAKLRHAQLQGLGSLDRVAVFLLGAALVDPPNHASGVSVSLRTAVCNRLQLQQGTGQTHCWWPHTAHAARLRSLYWTDDTLGASTTNQTAAHPDQPHTTHTTHTRIRCAPHASSTPQAPHQARETSMRLVTPTALVAGEPSSLARRMNRSIAQIDGFEWALGRLHLCMPAQPNPNPNLRNAMSPSTALLVAVVSGQNLRGPVEGTSARPLGWVWLMLACLHDRKKEGGS